MHRRMYAVFMDCPHATRPEVAWRVMVNDLEGGYELVDSSALLFVPQLETWTVDTLRMVLHELSAYLPAHDSDKAEGGIVAARTKNTRRLKDKVEIWVRARGWKAAVWTWVNERPTKESEPWPPPTSWSEPMAEVLVELAQRSPFRLEPLAKVLPGDPVDADMIPSRRCVLDGNDPPFCPDSREYDFEAMEMTRRVLARIGKQRRRGDK